MMTTTENKEALKEVLDDMDGYWEENVKYAPK